MLMTSLMKKLIMYTTLGCHLCEQALALITPLLDDSYDIEEVDISTTDELMTRYGIRIPVVARCDNHSEIGWPFDRAQFIAFLQSV